MGAAVDIEAWMQDPSSVTAYEKQQSELGDNPSDETVLNTRLIPDPRKVRMRVYQTNSTHLVAACASPGAVARHCVLRGRARFQNAPPAVLRSG